MAEENKKHTVEEAKNAAIRYGWAINNNFFDMGDGTMKFSRSMVHLRISWVGLIWGAGIGLTNALIMLSFRAAIGLSPDSMIYSLFFGTFPIILYSSAVGFLGYQLSRWSPMRKTTGESLFTYVGILFRQYVSRGGFSKGRAAKTFVYSRAKTLDGDGIKLRASNFIGTQPLSYIPPYDPDWDEEEHGEVFTTPYELYPRGEFSTINIPYDDGLRKD